MRRFAIVSVLLAVCCGRAEPPAASVEAPPVILISIDTLRSDRLPAYGYAGVATPHIDALRRDGVLYERAYTHAPLTLPAHASMLTGLTPAEHGVRNNIGYPFDGAKLTTLAEILRGRGYATGAAVSSYVLRSGTGINDGFDWYDDEFALVAGASSGEHQRAGAETLARARQWLAGDGAQRPFLMFHIYEPHAPYAAPEPFRSRYSDAYDAEIAAADAVIGELIATLKSSGTYDRALIVLTSDHGEALWQHGEDQHGILLYREVLQVPLIVKFPAADRANTSVQGVFAVKDVFGVILQTVGAPLSSPPAADAAVYSETLYPRIHLGWSELRSLIRGRYHYIESSSPELYDLENDPGETVNLLATERRVGAAMRRELAAIPSEVTAPGAIDPEEAAKLAALGYVGTPQQRSGPLPNPREQIHMLREIKSAFLLASQRRNDEAIVALRGLLDANPRQIDVASRLGEVLADSGRYEEAIAVYRSAIATTGRPSPDLALALATVYFKAGQIDEAVAHADLAVTGNPLDAHELIARIRMEEGRLPDAHRHVQLAVDAGRRQPRSLVLMAELQRAAGQLDDALRTIALAEARAVELSTLPPLGLDHVRADLLARLDRPTEAVAAYEREIERYPHHLQSYANLALIHLIEGRRREAVAVLDRMKRANPHRGAERLAERTLAALEN